MGPKVIKKNTFHVIGYRLHANMKEREEQDVIQQTVSHLKSIADRIPNKVKDDVLVIQYYPKMEEFNPFRNKDSLIIGYEVEKDSSSPVNTDLYTIEKNMYVNYKHTGTTEDIYKTYDYLYNTWILKYRFIPLGYNMEVWNEHGIKDINISITINKCR